MGYDDDDDIVLPPRSEEPLGPGRVELVSRYKTAAPLEKNTLKVMLELTGEVKSRSGLDLVAILDVSGSMKGEKIENLIKAMHFVIKKLSPVDRLSIVKYSSTVERLCPLIQVKDSKITVLENHINGLLARGNTNIHGGLQTGLDILKDRKFSSGRVGAIMLMSDGQENVGSAASVQVDDNVLVHTFGFGEGQDAKLLEAIAAKSKGGTYSDVRIQNLNLAFAQCLGGLLSVVAQDLTVTIAPVSGKSEISRVSTGRYPTKQDNADGYEITFGDIYMKEVRKVLIDLVLPDVVKSVRAPIVILNVAYTYKFNGKPEGGLPLTIGVTRVAGLTPEQQQPPAEVSAEEVRVQIAEVIKKAIKDADGGQLQSAQNKLLEGLKTLGDGDREKTKAALKAELKELLELMKTPAIYDKEGRPFAYSLLASHETQRQAARGNDISKYQLFATPAMQDFLKDAEQFNDIPNLEILVNEIIGELENIDKILDKV